MKFIGVDLAWGLKRPSALCIIHKDDNGFFYETVLHLFGLEDFMSFFHTHQEETLVLAIDAPLTVKNREGNRRPEREISIFLRRFRGGILPVNLTIVEQKYPRLALFWQLLCQNHFQITSTILDSFWRIAFEVFPPLIVLGLWGKETLETYWQEKKSRQRFPLFQQRIAELTTSFSPPLQGLERFFSALQDSSFFIDACDALLCAYAACFLWARGRRCARVFGTAQEGEVVMPVQEAQRDLVNFASSRA
ncbi:MAG: DUF429 domain-containing protein [Atribacterota bacterium]